MPSFLLDEQTLPAIGNLVFGFVVPVALVMSSSKSEQEQFSIVPESSTKAIDTSKWPLLLKVDCSGSELSRCGRVYSVILHRTMRS